MAETTGIEWAHATWNPWMGCTMVSLGCTNCYMFREMKMYGRDPSTVVRTSDATFYAPLKWVKRGNVESGARVFTCSWGDWFHEDADLWRDDAWGVIKATPQYEYLILTKRPERIESSLPGDWGSGYDNVWLLVSSENQRMFDLRWSILKSIPAKVRGISAEPLLGEIDIREEHPDWIITGGESDRKNPRPTDLSWVRRLRDVCVERGIAFFHKQHGGRRKVNGAWGGRELDGVEWNQFPR